MIFAPRSSTCAPGCPSDGLAHTARAAGERLWTKGYRGVLAPSAARPAGLVLCLFREFDELAGVTPLRPPVTCRRAPAPSTGMIT